MSKVFVIGYTEEISQELRASRKFSVRISDSKPLEVQYVMIQSRGIPTWIGKVELFGCSGGSFPKEVNVTLSEISFLGSAWTSVAAIIRDLNIENERIVDADVNQLFGVGDSWLGEPEDLEPLTANVAKDRLAWTYGVPKDKVKVSIEF